MALIELGYVAPIMGRVRTATDRSLDGRTTEHW